MAHAKHIRYTRGGNASCSAQLRSYTGGPDEEIENIRCNVISDAARDNGSAHSPAAESACPSVCNLRFSQKSWLKNHAGIADCGWVGSCCRHLIALQGGFLNMPAPECHIFYFKLLDEIVVNGIEDVDIFYLDIGCQLAASWLVYAKNKYQHDEVLYARAMALVIKVGWMHVMGHDEACQLENSAMYYHGAARTVGEQMEPLWQKISPLISTLRRCTADRRRDILNLALQQMNEEQETGLLKMLLDKLELAITKLTALDDAIKYLLRDSSIVLETTVAGALTLLRGWADELTLIQTQAANAPLAPLEWRAEWIIERVQLDHVQRLGNGEATMRLLFSSGGESPLVASADKLRDSVAKLERMHLADLHADGWDSPTSSILRVAPGFPAAFDSARAALLLGFERAAARLSCAIASIDETLRRSNPNSTGISFSGLKNSRRKHELSLVHQLELRLWWSSFSLERDAPAESWKDGLSTLVAEVLKGPPFPWDVDAAAIPAPPVVLGAEEDRDFARARALRHLLPLSTIMRFRTLDAEKERTKEEIELVPIEVERAAACVAWSRVRAGKEIGTRLSELSELELRGRGLDLTPTVTPQAEANQHFSKIEELEGELLILRGRLVKLDELHRAFTDPGLSDRIRKCVGKRGMKRRLPTA